MDELEDRIRAALSGREDVREVRMFGYRCFMVAERLRVGVGRGGALLVRAGGGRYEEALGWPGARPAMMRDRPMHGWVEVAPQGWQEEAALQRWLQLSLTDE